MIEKKNSLLIHVYLYGDNYNNKNRYDRQNRNNHDVNQTGIGSVRGFGI